MATLLVERERKISKGGNSSVLYLPKKYFSPGDKIKLKVMLKSNTIELIVTKDIFNFDHSDIKSLLTCDFEIKYDKNVAGVYVFDAANEDTSISYADLSSEDLKPANVIISKKLGKINSRSGYEKILQMRARITRSLKNEGIEVYLEPEGNLDIIQIYQNPKRFGLENEFEAIDALTHREKDIGFSLIAKFDSKNNTIDEIAALLKELEEFKSQVSS